MTWKIDDDRLPYTVLHSTLYIREENNTETMIGECSFTLGEVYIYQPLTTWLNLHDSDKVKNSRNVLGMMVLFSSTIE
jgi:hypothetical protein